MTRCRNPPSKHEQNTEDEPAVFIVRRPYRWVRRPWYLVPIMLFWSCVDFTSDRLLLNVLWTDWVCLGPGSNRSILCPTLGTSTKNIVGVFRCSSPGIIQLGWSSFLKPTAVPSAPVLDATGFRPVRHQTGSWSIPAVAEGERARQYRRSMRFQIYASL